LLLQLPLLLVTAEQEIDYAASDPAVLVYIAANAQACQQTVQRGLSCIGHLLARAAPEIESFDIPGDCIEALGFLLAELGDLASVALSLATACYRYTADYQPAEPVLSTNAKP
jgi:hypothetical protein